MRDTAGGDSWSPESDFEGMSHAELHKLAQTGNPESVIAAGNRLSAAGDSIQSLSDALNSHLAGLDWTSSAGDAFRGWARQVVQVTDCVADYHKTIGSFTAQAGTALQKVRSAVPPVSASDQQTVQSYHRQQGLLHTPKTVAGPHDPTFAPSVPGGVTQAQAQAAQSRLDAAHQEAIGAMETLGSTYLGSAQAMKTADVPVYPPTPTTIMPKRPTNIDGMTNVGIVGGGTSTTRSGGYAAETPVRPVAEPATTTSASRSAGSAGTSVDGVASPIPSRADATTSGGPAGPSGTKPVTSVNISAAAARAGSNAARAAEGISSSGRPGGSRSAFDRRAGLIGEEGNAAAGSANGFARGRLGGGTLAESPAGVVGGIEQKALPSRGYGGAVIGGESGTGAGLGGGQGAASGSATGAEESATASHGGMPMMGGGTGGFGARSRGRGSRPDYLVEDEEYWLNPEAPANPSVIDVE